MTAFINILKQLIKTSWGIYTDAGDSYGVDDQPCIWLTSGPTLSFIRLGSPWLNVTDTRSYEVIGEVQWIINETNPSTKPALPFKAYRWLEGKSGSGAWRRKEKG